jgi:NTE family protein
MIWGLLRQQISQGGDPPSAVDVRETHGLLNINPLWDYLCDQLGAPEGRLTGIPANLEADRLQAVAIVTTNYSTGQTVTWVQGDDFEVWERPDRISLHDQLTIDHVMASTALPLVFPAVKIGDAWYGDGGIRLQAPLAPAVHLGSDRILVISNRHRRSRPEAEQKAVHGYPPAAHIIGILMNSIFLDALDQDAFTLERVNTLVEELPPHQRHGMRPVDLLQLRPSVDLGRLAYDYEDRIPSSFQFLTSGLGTRETESLDWLSVLLFDPVYIDRLLDIGYHDARRRHDRIERFLSEMGEGGEKGRQRLGTPGEEDV